MHVVLKHNIQCTPRVMGLHYAPKVYKLGDCLLSSTHDGVVCNLGYLSKCVDNLTDSPKFEL